MEDVPYDMLYFSFPKETFFRLLKSVIVILGLDLGDTDLVVLLLQHLVAPAHLLQLLVHHLQLRLRCYQRVLVLLVVAEHPLQRDIEVTQFSVHPVGYYGKEQEMDGRLLCRSEDGHEGRHYI